MLNFIEQQFPMKKMIPIILSLYYLTATIGLAVSVHYCQGEVEAVGVFSEANGCCDENNTCCTSCTEEEYIVRAEVDDQLFVSNKFEIHIPGHDAADLHVWSDHSGHLAENLPYFLHDLQFPDKPPVWLLNCSLTFYG